MEENDAEPASDEAGSARGYSEGQKQQGVSIEI